MLSMNSTLHSFTEIEDTNYVVWEHEQDDRLSINSTLCPFSLKTDALRLDFLKGKKIVMFGDSVSRNQMINLFYWLTTGLWNTRYPNGEIYHIFKSWEEYYSTLRLRSACMLVCDCCELQSAWQQIKNGTPANQATVEIKSNMFYYHLPHNIQIIFHFSKGLCLPFSMDKHQTFYDKKSSILIKDPCINDGTDKPYCDLSDSQEFMIETYARNELKEFKPDVIIINQGAWIWCNEQKNDLKFMSALYEALNSSLSGQVPNGVVWKVTSQEHESDANLESKCYLDNLKKIGYELFDTYFFTAGLKSIVKGYERGNRNHFSTSVNEELNKRLISFLFDLFQ
jgi:hypothetical protein